MLSMSTISFVIHLVPLPLNENLLSHLILISLFRVFQQIFLKFNAKRLEYRLHTLKTHQRTYHLSKCTYIIGKMRLMFNVGHPEVILLSNSRIVFAQFRMTHFVSTTSCFVTIHGLRQK